MGTKRIMNHGGIWKIKCFHCSSPTNRLDAIFFQNFAASCTSSKVCRFSRCANCYQEDPDLHLPIRRAFNGKSEYYRQRRDDEFKYYLARPIKIPITPFQCECCCFKNEYDIEPSYFSTSYEVALGVIWCANLDLFWSREAITGRGICDGINELVRCTRAARRRAPLEDIITWKVGEDVGMGIVMEILEKSIDPGGNSDINMRFNTCRNLCPVAINIYADMSQESDLR